MHRFALLMAALAFVIVVPARAADEDPAKEKMKLVGNWTVEKLEDDGLDAAGEIVKQLKVTITEDEFVWKGSDVEDKVKYSADPAKKPHAEFDMTALKGPNKDKVCPGIYKLDGDTLRICAAKTPTTPRPADFATKSNSGLTMMVLKRAK